jgi:predicted alpha/beta-hydrolase family hydrolase
MAVRRTPMQNEEPMAPRGRSDQRLILLAPGAGAPSSSGWMRAWAERLATLGRVVPFDYAYQREGRRRPDRLPALIAAHREALAHARAGHDGPVFLAGKSMGGRIGCHVSLEERVDGLICFGYPLKGTSGAIRDEVLRQLTTPVILVQGTRDPLCPLDLLETVTPHLSAPHVLHVVQGGDHSLLVRKADLARQGKTQADVDAEILAAVSAFTAGAGRTA